MFPTTGVLDNANRAAEGPPPSASWGAPIYSGQSGLVVSANQLAASAVGWKDSYWSATVFGADQEVFATIATSPAGENAIFLHFRLQTSGLGTSPNGYVARFGPGSPDWTLSLAVLQAGALTTLGTFVTVPATNFAAGVAIGAEAIGSTLRALYKPAAGSWTEALSRTDTTWTGAGRVGAEINDTTIRLDDFGGGNVVTGGAGTPFGKRLVLMGRRR